ncbi:DMT family transporter [Paludibacterium denitrificans]|uniref:DMT family transporter n=1 Tax=Paludibacterium denitrificans TaxID=2675226 RepID=UPI001E39D3F1|nr:DMT family transporter [Paludibacterium denitrificans]
MAILPSLLWWGQRPLASGAMNILTAREFISVYNIGMMAGYAVFAGCCMLPYLALTTAMLLWASSFIALKYVFAVFDPLVVLFARMVIASLCLLPLLWRASLALAVSARRLEMAVGPGLAEPCVYFLCEAKALQYTSVSQAGIITATLPLLVAVSAMLFLKERQGRQMWLGIAVSFAGVAWLSLSGESSQSAPNPLLGNALEFMAMLCAAAYVLITKKLSARYSALSITGIQSLLGSLWFGAWVATPWVSLPTSLPFWPSLWVVYLGAGITLGAYGLYSWSVSKVPVSMAAAFINLIPVFTIILAGACWAST